MKCFYHSADLDGHCSGAIVKLKYSECEMIGINYGEKFPWERIRSGEDVFMVDFGLRFSDMERLNKISNLTWIDHHKTSIVEAQERNFKASGSQLLKVGIAACELTWMHLNNCIYFSKIPWAVKLLGRYDVWDHRNKNILPFQYGMRQLKDTSPDNIQMWGRLFNDEAYVKKFLKKGQLFMDYEEVQNARYCKAHAFETEFNNMKVICVNRGNCNSIFFNSVYNPDRHCMMISFVRNPKKGWTVKLYATRDDIDCGAIAKSFGGGGHRGAAGFQCTLLPFSV